MNALNRDFFNFFTRISNTFLSSSKVRCISTSWSCKSSDDSQHKSKNPNERKGGVFKVFQDEESPIILDVEEERALSSVNKTGQVESWDEFYGIHLERGLNGVYEIDDLINVVRKNNGQNIFVVKVPEVINYVDYLVIVSCTSKRHIYALTQFVIKVYKRKRHKTDPIPPVVGDGASDWVALDLGNIALHVMTEPMREKYDLETLWSVGPKFDDLSVKSDDSVLEILQKHSINLDDFKPVKQVN